MSFYTQYLQYECSKLNSLLNTSTTRFKEVLKKKYVEDVADLTLDCTHCGNTTSIIDCHEVEMICQWDNSTISPICSSCYDSAEYEDACLQYNQEHSAKHHN